MEDNRRKDKLQFLAEHLISLGFCAFSLLIVCWNQVGWLPWLAGGFLLWWESSGCCGPTTPGSGQRQFRDSKAL